MAEKYPSPSSTYFVLIFRLLLKITVGWAHSGDLNKFLEVERPSPFIIINKRKLYSKIYIYN